MKAAHQHHLSVFLILLSLAATQGVASVLNSASVGEAETHRRILHQPLFPAGSAPPPGTDSTSPPPPPPSPPSPSDVSSGYPFFGEGGSSSDQIQPPPSALPANGVTGPIPVATQPGKPTKTVAIAISVGIVTLGMLSALAFFLYRHRAKHPDESSKKLVRGSSRGHPGDTRVPPSNFLYIGTVEPGPISSVSEASGEDNSNSISIRSPYHKLNSVKRSDRYRPSPELQPLPPLTKPPNANSPSPRSSSDEESHDTSFHSPNCSSLSYEESSYYTPTSSRTANNYSNAPASVIPHSKRTSPKSRLSSSSSTNHAPPPPPPPPPPPSIPIPAIPYSHGRPRFSSPPPPPPSLARLQATISNPVPPPPPPPPPPLPRKVESSERNVRPTPPPQVWSKSLSWNSSPKAISSQNVITMPAQEVSRSANPCERLDWDDDKEGAKPKLKPLHWDKVRATSDRATVWDQLKSSSFQ